MDYLQFSIEMAIMNVKSNKKALHMQLATFIANLMLSILVAFYLYYHPLNLILAGCLGAYMVNLLWILIILSETKWSLKCSRKYLHIMKDKEKREEISSAIENYNVAREKYENAFHEMKKNAAPKDGETQA